jgi:hypothetical protein
MRARMAGLRGQEPLCNNDCHTSHLRRWAAPRDFVHAVPAVMNAVSPDDVRAGIAGPAGAAAVQPLPRRMMSMQLRAVGRLIQADRQNVGRGTRGGALLKHPARTIEPALLLGRKRFHGVACRRVWRLEGRRRRRADHPRTMCDPVAGGRSGRSRADNEQSGERHPGL